MKLSKSKPNIKHKKIISLNLNTLKNSNNIKNKESKIKENEKFQTSEENPNKNNINNNDLEITDSTQLDWVNSAIQVKTKNNGIIKLSLENENFLEQIKTNIIEKNKNLDFKNKEEINEYKLNEKINNKDSRNMISTKEIEKLENNLKYLSKINNKHKEIIFPENIKNICDDNNNEDMVNMKTLSLLNECNEFSYGNNLFSKNKIYKKRLKMGYFRSKNNSKNSINPIIVDNRNKINFLKNGKFYTKVDKKIINNKRNNRTNERMMSIDLCNKNVFQKNISFPNIYSDNISINNHDNLNIITKKYIPPYSNTRNKFQKMNNLKLKFSELNTKNYSLLTNYLNTEKTEDRKINPMLINDNTNKILNQTYKFITPKRNYLKQTNKYYPLSSSKFIKKNISHKFILSSNNKSNLLLRNFLSKINLQKYYSILKKNGFDNINLLIEQMKTNTPIKDFELKKAGISIPGDRAKILIRLEEKGNLYPFQIPKNVYYSLDNNNNNNINGSYINKDNDENIIELKKWLKEFKLENYLDNFIKNGYHSVELFLFQMTSKNPSNDDILQFEIGIDKIGHRSRILSILKEESKNMKEKIDKKGPIIFNDETKNCECLIY